MIRWPESGKLSHHEFEQAAGVIIGEEFVYPVTQSREEKKMIPQETADLAEALQAEFPDLDRDAALMRAHSILEAFKRKGWKIVEVVG